MLFCERLDHQDQPSPPMSIHSSLKGHGVTFSFMIFASIGYASGLQGKNAEQQFSLTYFRNKFSYPKRNPGVSVILVARLIRLGENVCKLLLHP